MTTGIGLEGHFLHMIGALVHGVDLFDFNALASE
jgi:hypothetical protein